MEQKSGVILNPSNLIKFRTFFLSLKMVYKKTYGKRKTNYKKRYRRKNTQNGWVGMAKKALKTASYVAKLVNSEFKEDNTSTVGGTCNWNGVITTLCNPGQGVSANQREGDSIKMKNLTLRGDVYRTNVDCVVRIIIYLDKENTIATGADLLQITGSGLVLHSPKNEDNKYQSKILHDKTYTLTNAQKVITTYEWVYKIEQHVHFQSGSTTIKDGALKIAYFSNIVPGVNEPGFNFYSTVSYVDN